MVEFLLSRHKLFAGSLFVLSPVPSGTRLLGPLVVLVSVSGTDRWNPLCVLHARPTRLRRAGKGCTGIRGFDWVDLSVYCGGGRLVLHRLYPLIDSDSTEL